MGFAARLDLPFAAGAVHWVSLPTVYGPATAEELCQAVGGAAEVARVWRWDEPSSTLVPYACGTGSGSFALVAGTAYGLENAAGQTVDAVVRGAHDDGFAFALPATTGSSLSFVSLPYHLVVSDGGGVAGVVDAQDLCAAIGGAVAAVVRVDAASGSHEAFACGSVFDTPFALEPTRGYGLLNAPGAAIAWSPPHW
jgi:hypothetical protein